MRVIVRAYKKNPDIRFLAGDLTRHLPNKAWASEVSRLFEYVKSRVRYTEDITEIETIQTPDATLALGYGDCDDMAVLLAALLESIGKPTRFVAIGFQPNRYEHVFTQVRIGGKNDWVTLDPTENQPMGWTPPGFVSWMIRDN
jgi:transglutaminase-like putative cysteine protease